MHPRLHHPNAAIGHLSPDGSRVLGVRRGRIPVIWDLDQPPRNPVLEGSYFVEPSPDGRFLATRGVQGAQHHVQLFYLSTLDFFGRSPALPSWPAAASYTSAGETILIGNLIGNPASAEISKLNSRLEIYETSPPFPFQFKHIRLHPTLPLAYVNGWDFVGWWNHQTGSGWTTLPARELDLSRNGDWLAIAHKHNVNLLKPGERVPRATWGYADSYVGQVAVSDDGRFVAASGDQGHDIDLLTTPDLTPVAQITGHRARVGSLQFIGRNRLLSASSDRTIRLWEIPSGREMLSLPGEGGGARYLENLKSVLGLGSTGSTIWRDPRRRFQAPQTLDALQFVEVESHGERGIWTRSESGFSVEPTRQAFLRLPLDLRGSYELTVEFSRGNAGKDRSVEIMLPVGDQRAKFVLDGWRQTRHCLLGVDDKDGVNTQYQVKSSGLENERRHFVRALVNVDGAEASIRTELNGEPLIQWSGRLSEMDDRHQAGGVSRARQIGLGGNYSAVTFHSAKLHIHDGHATLWPENSPPQEPKPVGDPRDEVDLLSLVDETTPLGGNAGKLKRFAEGFSLESVDATSKLQFPVVPRGGYEWDLAFSLDHARKLKLVLPLQTNRIILGMEFERHRKAGLSQVDGDASFFAPGNPTSIDLKPLSRNEPHNLNVKIAFNGADVDIQSRLNGEPFLRWRGATSRLSIWRDNELPLNGTPGIIAHRTSATFHRVTLKMLDGKAWVLPDGRDDAFLFPKEFSRKSGGSL